MPPKAIPDRWIPYKACGEVIEGTRFICFKVPLKRSVQNNVREIEKIWDIPAVLADIPKLGAVIDLTNTARYYNPTDFLKANISHRKILMPGRIIPPESSVKEFTDAADEFLAKNSDSLIGVHCTHGLNRTGFMVCRYMQDRLGIPAKEAIARFEAARGYKIERAIYISALLGMEIQPDDVGKETEIISVHNRRNDLTYRSPVGDYSECTEVDNSKRFGKNRAYDKHGNKYVSNQNSNRTGNNSSLFSCYTNRYNNDGNYSGRSDSERSNGYQRSNELPLSWRNQGGSSQNSSRNRPDDSSVYKSKKRTDRSRTRDH